MVINPMSSMFERNVIKAEDRHGNTTYLLHRDGRIVYESSELSEVEEAKARFDERDADSPSHQKSIYGGDPDSYMHYHRRS